MDFKSNAIRKWLGRKHLKCLFINSYWIPLSCLALLENDSNSNTCINFHLKVSMPFTLMYVYHWIYYSNKCLKLLTHYQSNIFDQNVRSDPHLLIAFIAWVAQLHDTQCLKQFPFRSTKYTNNEASLIKNPNTLKYKLVVFEADAL